MRCIGRGKLVKLKTVQVTLLLILRGQRVYFRTVLTSIRSPSGSFDIQLVYKEIYTDSMIQSNSSTENTERKIRSKAKQLSTAQHVYSEAGTPGFFGKGTNTDSKTDLSTQFERSLCGRDITGRI